jgi:hypothetical protein
MEFIRNEFKSRYRFNVHVRELSEVVAGFGTAGVESQTLWLVESRKAASEAILSWQSDPCISQLVDLVSNLTSIQGGLYED